MISQYPLDFGQWLQALSYAFSRPREIAVVGEMETVDTQGLLAVARDGYRPFQVVVVGAPDKARPAGAAAWESRTVGWANRSPRLSSCHLPGACDRAGGATDAARVVMTLFSVNPTCRAWSAEMTWRSGFIRVAGAGKSPRHKTP